MHPTYHIALSSTTITLNQNSPPKTNQIKSLSPPPQCIVTPIPPIEQNEGRGFELVFAMGRGTSISERTHAFIANPNYSWSSHGLQHSKLSHHQYCRTTTPKPTTTTTTATFEPFPRPPELHELSSPLSIHCYKA